MPTTLQDTGVFFAFAAKPPGVGDTIEQAIADYRIRDDEFKILPWTELNVSGVLIWKKILEEIDQRPFLIADVTALNPNVTYEIGYAIGKRKKIRFVLHSELKDDMERSRIGIYDVLGYEAYETKDELFDFMCSSIGDAEAIFVDDEVDQKAPIFLFDAYEKSELVNHIKTCVKKYLVRFRSYDPQEQARLPVHEAVREVALSEGVVVSLVPPTYPDAGIHNLRAAFVAGLSHGMGKELTIIQLGDDATPLDFREFADVCYAKEHIKHAIEKFTLSVTPRLQSRVHKAPRADRSLLEQIDLGGSVAENELQSIDSYYHDTDAYLRASHGEVRLTIGRKGSGKTALFLRLRNEKRRRSANIVVDLKPEGYKLLKFKERIVDALSEGSLNHVVSAIWEYVLLLELAYKLLEKDRDIYARDARLIDKYQSLKSIYEQDEYYSGGDFSERVSVLLDDIGAKIDSRKGTASAAILSQREITELIYKHPINELRAEVVNYLALKSETWVLVDNLDKGWPGSVVTKGDVVLISCLLEALEKIARSFRQRRYEEFYSVVFLRGDIYENLINTSSDRGKIIPVSVDWSDPSALKELLRKRFVYSKFDDRLEMDHIWEQIAPQQIDGKNSLDFVIEQCLYRPRALVDFVYVCKSIAVNRRHQKIQEDDLREAVRRFSIQLIDNIGLELRDINPKYENLLYQFIDREPTLNRSTIRKIIKNFLKEENLDEEEQHILDLLLWFGFLGVENETGGAKFIFDVDYNMNMLRALSLRRGTSARFVIHSAFRSGLAISEPASNPQIRLL